MQYKFMHKNIIVAIIDIDNETGNIIKIIEVFNSNHLPLGVNYRNGVVDRSQLNEWWIERSIPGSRMNIRDALNMLNIHNSKQLLTKCYGLNLSDQYWVCPYDLNTKWENVDFFTNDFSSDIGDVLFGKKANINNIDYMSPDSTSDGNLKKRWIINKGKRYLIKSGSNPFMQQPFCEVIADKIMNLLDVEHVSYNLIWKDEKPYSVCEDFINKNTELIPARRIIQTKKKENNVSWYNHFIDCCDSLGIIGTKEFLDKMIVVDYIIANEDRHLNNFGVIRNAETLEWIGFAPIYDSGSSLAYDKTIAQIISGKNISCKPFKTSHEEQLKLVSSFDWINFNELKKVDEIIDEVFSLDHNKEYIDDSRKTAIINLLHKRINYLYDFTLSHNENLIDMMDDDVAEDVASSYDISM